MIINQLQHEITIQVFDSPLIWLPQNGTNQSLRPGCRKVDLNLWHTSGIIDFHAFADASWIRVGALNLWMKHRCSPLFNRWALLFNQCPQFHLKPFNCDKTGAEPLLLLLFCRFTPPPPTQKTKVPLRTCKGRPTYSTHSLASNLRLTSFSVKPAPKT